MKKLLALAVCAALLMTCLAGCGGVAAETTPTPEPTATPTETPAEETPAETTEAPAEPTVDVTALLDAASAVYEPDTVVMTVNGQPVSWAEYFYWMYSAVAQLETYTNYYFGTSIFDDLGGSSILDSSMTNAEYIKQYADNAVVWYHAVSTGIENAGVTVSDEDKAELEALYQSDVTSYGGGDEQAFEDYLATMYLTLDVYKYVNEFYCLYENGFDSMYGVKGADLGDAEVLEYAEGDGYLAAKHILLMTTDEAGEALDETAKAEAQAKAEGILAQLQAVQYDQAALVELFDKLMNENSEDPGLASFPNGYCFLPETMVDEFSTATQALGEYGLSELVESSHGYHIIMRLPLDPAMTTEYNDDGTEAYDLRYIVATAMFGANTDSWTDEATVVYGEGFENLDVTALFA